MKDAINMSVDVTVKKAMKQYACKNVYGILVYVVVMVIKPLIVIQKCCW